MRLLRVVAVLASIAVILFGIERSLFSYERASLFAWWWLHGNSDEDHQPISNRVDAEELPAYKSEIAAMLKNAEQNSVTQDVALAFVDEFTDDPVIQDQLIIVAHDHPNALVRCYWQQKLKTGHELRIITTDKGVQSVSKFPLLAKECETIKNNTVSKQ